jgi:hypothetical protein
MLKGAAVGPWVESSIPLPASCNWLARDCSLRSVLMRLPDLRPLKSSNTLGIIAELTSIAGSGLRSARKCSEQCHDEVTPRNTLRSGRCCLEYRITAHN